MTTAALRGYVLEEVLAKLLHSSGYHLLTQADQDHDALKSGSNGLLVRGRGANHQADALGDLKVPIPFSLPVRLFVEAKFKKSRVGLEDVRNALAVVTDVNERHSTDSAKHLRIPLRRHHYRYSLFSTSGFTAAAEAFALTHQISLIDLQGPAFRPLRVLVRQAARDLLDLQRGAGAVGMPVGQVRAAIRSALETGAPVDLVRWTPMDAGLAPAGLPTHPLRRLATHLADEVAGLGLILGFLRAPFVLALKPDDVAAFEEWLADAGAVERITIRFAGREQAEGDWVIVPRTAPRRALLRFGVPPRLLAWLLSGEGDAKEVAQEFFSSIVVFGARGRSVELRLDERSRESQRYRGLSRREMYDALRVELADPTLAEAPPPQPRQQRLRGDHAVWNAGAVEELLRRLRHEGRTPQVRILGEAAQTGSISRQRILELSGQSTLHGVIKPIWRITTDLIVAGRLSPAAEPALMPASGRHRYVMPDDLATLLRDA
jgi:hypothetical protein